LCGVPSRLSSCLAANRGALGNLYGDNDVSDVVYEDLKLKPSTEDSGLTLPDDIVLEVINWKGKVLEAAAQASDATSWCLNYIEVEAADPDDPDSVDSVKGEGAYKCFPETAAAEESGESESEENA
jgi:hypothetical protein